MPSPPRPRVPAVRSAETCPSAALAGYAAGLAAWRMNQPDLALPMFEAGWRAELSTSALRAATAFWAARAHLRVRDPAGYVPWMQRAAEERRTFYGMLARRTLGLDVGFGPGGRDVRETLGEADIEAVAATPQGMRAFALLQVGQDHRAEAELRRLWPHGAECAGARPRHHAGGRRTPGWWNWPRSSPTWCSPPTGGRATTCASRCRACARPAGSASIRRWSMASRAPNSNFDADLGLAGRRASG